MTCSVKHSMMSVLAAGEVHSRFERPCSSRHEPCRPCFARSGRCPAGSHVGIVRFILDEFQRVLLYPRIQSRYQITADEIARFADNLAEVAHLIEPTIVKPLVEFDPDDDPVLYTAAEGQADILCQEISAILLLPRLNVSAMNMAFE